MNVVNLNYSYYVVTMKILLAEDSRSNQMLIRAYIEEACHQVITVDHDQQAIDAFRTE
jgi:CheY-like chemotaxis protein